MRWLKQRRLQHIFLLGVLLAAGWQLLPVLLLPEVDGLPVMRGDLLQIIPLTANLQDAEQFEIKSAQSGKVAKVVVAIGDNVKAGQVLLSLDNAAALTQLADAGKALALAQLRFKQAKEKLRSGSDQVVDQAKASLNHARQQYARISGLAERGMVSQAQAADALRNLAITQNQLNNAQFQARVSRAQGSEYAMAESALKNARELVAAAQKKLDDTQLHSPQDGVVTAALAGKGQGVKAGDTVMQLATANSPLVHLTLAAASIKLVRPGAPVAVMRDQHAGIAQEIPLGKIPQDFDGTQSEASLAFRLDAHLPQLQHAAPLNVQIEAGQLRDVLSLDVSAIHEVHGKQPWVMAVRDGKAQRQNIRIGANGLMGGSHSLRMQVLEGLREGDVVLPASLHNIEEGKRIRLARNA